MKSIQLSQNDSLQTEQLTELKNLFKSAQAQIEIQKIQIDIQNEQLKGISDQLAITSRHYSIVQRSTESDRLINFVKLKKAVAKINLLLAFPLFEEVDYMDTHSKIALVNDIDEIVDGELRNPYLAENRITLDRWVDVTNKCERASWFIVRMSQQDSLLGWIGPGSGPSSVENKKREGEIFVRFISDIKEFISYNNDSVLCKDGAFFRGK